MVDKLKGETRELAAANLSKSEEQAEIRNQVRGGVHRWSSRVESELLQSGAREVQRSKQHSASAFVPLSAPPPVPYSPHQMAIIRSGEYAPAKAAFDDKWARQQAVLAKLSPDVLVHRCGAAGKGSRQQCGLVVAQRLRPVRDESRRLWQPYCVLMLRLQACCVVQAAGRGTGGGGGGGAAAAAAGGGGDQCGGVCGAVSRAARPGLGWCWCETPGCRTAGPHCSAHSHANPGVRIHLSMLLLFLLCRFVKAQATYHQRDLRLQAAQQTLPTLTPR